MKYFYLISPGVTVHTVLRDGSFSCDIPGSKLPGYYHSVPMGPKLSDLCPHFRLRTARFEDDEYEYEPLDFTDR